MGTRFAVRILTFIVVALVAGGAQVDAQYFGRNKVQYETFEFQILRTSRFDIYFYEAERDRAIEVGRLAERWHARLARVFGADLRGRQPIILYASHPDFRQTNVLAGEVSEATGGVTESLRRRVVLPLGGSLAETDHVLGHELVHAFQFDITSRAQPGHGTRLPGAQFLPLWFVEGMAEYLSLGPRDVATATWLRDAASHDELPRVRDLARPRYFPYRWGHALWAYVGGRWGDEVVGPLLREAASTGDVDRAFQSVLGIQSADLTDAWHGAIETSVRPVLASTRPAAAYGRALFASGSDDSRYQLGPALSPDGTRVAFLSERDLLTMDLYVAEVASGRILARVAGATKDAHLGSLQFTASSGAWDRHGRHLAFATIRRGKPEIAIYDAEVDRITRRLVLDELDEVLTPTWAPDGSAIGFTGMRGGSTDLYVYHLQTGELGQLTDDPFADLQPAWSPDGAAIAFATDRVTTDTGQLRAGPLGIALVHLDTRRIDLLTVGAAGHATSPQWTGSGELMYVEDGSGIANVHRLSLATGAREPVTHLVSGVGGLTPASPALSVALDAPRMAFTVFERDGYRLYVGELAAEAAPSARWERSPALLPPADRQRSVVDDVLDDPGFGLPDDSTFEVAPYRARLGLDYVTQQSVGVSVDRYGTALGGALMVGLSDMLGDHNVVAAVDTSITIDRFFSATDIGALVQYQNLSRRWNWGLAVEQIPYRTGFVGAGITTFDGRAARVEQTAVYRQTARGGAGLAAYPFNETRRLELFGAARHYSFDQQVWTRITTPEGQVLLDETERSAAAPSLALARVGAALVGDRTFFGATGPVAGERYRLELAPTIGSVRYSGVLSDYRRYFMPVSFYTVAARALHYGRYGSGADDPRLLPLFLGYPELVRGYDFGSFSADECRPDGTCPVFDQLFGSRLLVANLELRMPLLRPFGGGRGMYGPIPTELAVFTDAGVAWDRTHTPALVGGTRSFVRSAGVAVRVNALGFAIVQLSWARPFDRRGRGWVWQLSLTPGF